MENIRRDKPMGFSAIQIGYGGLGVHLYTHLSAHFNNKVSLFKNEAEFEVKSKEGLGVLSPDYVFLAVPDKNIDSYVDLFSAKAKVVHFSGFHYNTKALGAHPVQSFSKEGEYDLNEIKFVVDGGLDSALKEIFKNVTFINPERKRTYHTYISTVANSFQLMVNQLGESFVRETDLSENLLKEIVIQSLEREKNFGSKSFSGPWVRGDKSAQDEQIKEIDDPNLTELNELFQKTIERYKNEHS